METARLASLEPAPPSGRKGVRMVSDVATSFGAGARRLQR
ncbi:hypothetical protein BH20VER1_BH20VER1_14560 [soil metagenome]